MVIIFGNFHSHVYTKYNGNPDRLKLLSSYLSVYIEF